MNDRCGELRDKIMLSNPSMGGALMIARLFTRDISLVFAASFFYMSCSFIATPLIAGFSESLGAGAVFMGIIGATFNTVALLSRPFVGNLADRLSRAHLSSIGAALMLVGSAGYVLAPAPAVVMLARIVHGLGMSCCSICMSTWIAGLLPREHTGAGMGLYGATNALGQAVAPALGIFLYERIGYRLVFLLGTALALAVLIVIRFVSDKGAPHPQATAKKHRGLVAPNVVPVGLIIMLFAIPYCATQTYLVSYIAARGLAVHAGWFFPFYAIVLLVLRLSLADLFDKKPFRFFLGVSACCALVSLALLTVMQSNLALLAAAVCMAGGYGIMCSVCQSAAVLLVDESERGLGNSTYYIGIDFGMAVGAFIGGLLYGYVPLVWFYPILALTVPAAIGVYLVCRKRFHRI